MWLSTAVLVLACAGAVVSAQVRPQARDDGEGTAPIFPDEIAQPQADMRPEARPYLRPELSLGANTRAEQRAEQDLFAFSPNAIAQSLRPEARPATIVQAALSRAEARRRGQICGDPDLQGDTLGSVAGPGACGVENAVRVRAVAGVTLTSQPVIDCRTAKALKRWVVSGARPAVADTGGGIASLRIIGGYSCRNRNARSSGRLSEHAFGHAVDIAGIGLKNGREITVLTDWNTKGDGARLRQMHRAACGPFGTVLGPNANAFHRDHFHFDTARYRSGSYCR